MTTLRESADALTPELVSELRNLAQAAARSAGELVRDLRRGNVAVAATKSSLTDIVTASDLASETALRAAILSARPDDGFVGEEGSDVASRSGLTWVVDPIDGTVNYLYGRASYAVSVAVVLGDPRDPLVWEPVAGAVHAPELGVTYLAGSGLGATRNDVALTLGAGPDLGNALVSTGFSYSAEERARQGATFAALIPQVRDIRRAGAGAIDVCDVAAGLLDAHFELGLKPWDIAAAVLVVSEAGGAVRYSLPNEDGDRVTLVTTHSLLPCLVAATGVVLAPTRCE